MSDNNTRAEKVYNDLCDIFKKQNWNYKEFPEDRVVSFVMTGEDIPMEFIVSVDEKRQLVRLSSKIPVKFSEGKRIEGAVAACVASYNLADGNFDYDITDGTMRFRMTASFRECDISEALLIKMLIVSAQTVDRFNDKFVAINTGVLSLEDFIKESD